MTSLAPIASRLGQLVRMLGSPIDGEALAAARAIDRTLKRAGASFHDLAEAVAVEPHTVVVYRSPPPPEKPKRKPAKRRAVRKPLAWERLTHKEWLQSLDMMLKGDRLTAWERGFVSSLRTLDLSWPGRPITLKQAATINGIIATAWPRRARA